MDIVSVVLLLTIVVLLFAIMLGPRQTESYSRPPMPLWLVWAIRLAIILIVGRIAVYLLNRYGFL